MALSRSYGTEPVGRDDRGVGSNAPADRIGEYSPELFIQEIREMVRELISTYQPVGQAEAEKVYPDADYREDDFDFDDSYSEEDEDEPYDEA